MKIDKIKISNFKNLESVDLKLAPLTVVTGCNSTGKSSLLQAILTIPATRSSMTHYEDYFVDFRKHRNRFLNAKEFSISLEGDGYACRLDVNESSTVFSHGETDKFFNLEDDVFYLSANRAGAANVVKSISNLVSGPDGEALLGTFEKEKSMPLELQLAKDAESLTLSSQVNWWLTYILGQRLELATESRPDNNIEVKYQCDELPDILPTQLGAGVSYIAKIIILCLRAPKGSLIMIENPEIHLYPRAQSRLAEFMSFVVNSGRQLIVETHSDILLTKLRHEVFSGKLKDTDLLFLYKGSILKPYKSLSVDVNGHWRDDFPKGFFDSSLAELLEMD